MDRSKRALCVGALSGLGALLCGGALKAQEAAKPGRPARVIKIQAKKFSYTPNRIVLKKGEPVVLALSALDFVHGFSIPALHIRADLAPGQTVKIHLQPEQPGEYDFLCDNFCGDGHEDMSGKLIVQA